MEPEILIGEKVGDDEEVTEPFSQEEIKETVSMIETVLTQPPARLSKRKRKTHVEINSYGTCINCSFVFLKISQDLREEAKVSIPEDKRMYYAKLMKTMLAGVESLIAITRPHEGERKVVNNLGIGFVIDGKRI